MDARHLPFLKKVIPNWLEKKPSLRQLPFVVFFDEQTVQEDDVVEMWGALSNIVDLTFVGWPDKKAVYPAGTCKWDNPQRAKMLSGFVYTAAEHVETEYWIKLDLDAVATGKDDWIDPSWFTDKPAIIAHRWNYTKPADQMDRLDLWFAEKMGELPSIWHNTTPLSIPKTSEDRLVHPRIASWCSLYSISFTRICREVCELCPVGSMPVPSQDGFMWYCATRLGLPVLRLNMKAYGWNFTTGLHKVEKALSSI